VAERLTDIATRVAENAAQAPDVGALELGRHRGEPGYRGGVDREIQQIKTGWRARARFWSIAIAFAVLALVTAARATGESDSVTLSDVLRTRRLISPEHAQNVTMGLLGVVVTLAVANAVARPTSSNIRDLAAAEHWWKASYLGSWAASLLAAVTGLLALAGTTAAAAEEFTTSLAMLLSILAFEIASAVSRWQRRRSLAIEGEQRRAERFAARLDRPGLEIYQGRRVPRSAWLGLALICAGPAAVTTASFAIVGAAGGDGSSHRLLLWAILSIAALVAFMACAAECAISVVHQHLRLKPDWAAPFAVAPIALIALVILVTFEASGVWYRSWQAASLALISLVTAALATSLLIVSARSPRSARRFQLAHIFGAARANRELDQLRLGVLR